ncbi:MAG: nucleotidyltransferase domain-containing protein [Clostridium sp.]
MPYNVKIELDNLLKEINEVSQINSIYLFGSYAYGEPNEESDLDICIITDDRSRRKIDIMKTIRKAMAKVATMPIDILVYYSDEFNERAKNNLTMENEILLQGIKIN